MKPTYYKLNREKAEELLPNGNINDVTFKTLEGVGILEEVQEEELFHVRQNDKCYIHKGNVFKYEPADTKEDLPYSVEIANRKLQEESKQAIDNMFGNPLEQVDSMIEGIKMDEDGHQLTGVCAICTSEVKLSSSDPNIGMRCRKYKAVKGPESKPFLDGRNPSDIIRDKEELRDYRLLDKDMDKNNYAAIKAEATVEVIDLLVEELKKKGSL